LVRKNIPFIFFISLSYFSFSYDLDRKEWSAPIITGPTPKARAWHAATTYRSCVLCFGGHRFDQADDYEPEEIYVDLLCLDWPKKCWAKFDVTTSIASPSPRCFCAIEVVNNCL
jgi:hypothetical protein